MIIRDIPITEARHELTSLPGKFRKEPGTALAVTKRGKPVLAVLPWDLYESLIETLEIMGDDGLLASLRQGIKELKKGKGIPWEQVKKELGL